jgi:hypothetical protein
MATNNARMTRKVEITEDVKDTTIAFFMVKQSDADVYDVVGSFVQEDLPPASMLLWRTFTLVAGNGDRKISNSLGVVKNFQTLNIPEKLHDVTLRGSSTESEKLAISGVGGRSVDSLILE